MARKLMAALAFAVAVTVGLAPRALADAAGAWQAYQTGRYVAAAGEIKALAEAGDAAAQFYLGTLYADGLAVGRDHGKSAEWYVAAAARGQGDAKFALGFLYLNGAGEGAGAVPADPALAARWLKEAAAQGNVAAQSALAVAYGEGYGTAPGRQGILPLGACGGAQGQCRRPVSDGSTQSRVPGNRVLVPGLYVVPAGRAPGLSRRP